MFIKWISVWSPGVHILWSCRNLKRCAWSRYSHESLFLLSFNTKTPAKGPWLLVEKHLRTALLEHSHRPSNDSGKALYHCRQTQSYNLLSIHIVPMPRKFVLLHFLDPSHICPPPISLSIALEESSRIARILQDCNSVLPRVKTLFTKSRPPWIS